MAELKSALATRRQKGQEDQVYEGYGKRKFSFKEGKRGAHPDPKKLLQSMQVQGVEAPTDPIDPEDDEEEQKKGNTYDCSNQQEGQQEQQEQEQQPQEQQQQQQGEQQQQEASTSGKPQRSAGQKEKKWPLQLSHRYDWKSRDLALPVFAKNEKSPEVQKAAKALAAKYHLPSQVAIRIALLYQFEYENIGKMIADIYLEAIQLLTAGIMCSKLCHESLKVKRKQLRVKYPDGLLLLANVGLARHFSSPTQIDFRTVQDLYIGIRHSPAFSEVNKIIKPLKQQLQESRCCVLVTVTCSYSLLMDRPKDLAALCAVVDVSTGRHGPAVWETGGYTDSVFATGLQAERFY
ncbi:hypothetical protein, conserved [Eimeria tenella]|uniref:Uncharacterized protein n=1 Tax=Eimeria tenella TaxID=5802 RepID=U6KNT4_EIMTE|nr:hypothetical protein, conserved [Eimeria tenella]CDJ37922.1 hypothetical protein, conserved [Eimeria tenella]|eukprot:XP_013228760.1 hypothetical protein, conserved [Eimeria tenella]